MNSKTERIGEVSRILDKSGQTTRNYCDEFTKHLSPDATKKTGKRFNDKDIEVLIYAKSLLEQGKTYVEVSEILDQETPLTGEVIDDIPPEPKTDSEDSEPEDTSLVPIEFFNRFVEQLQEQHQTTIDAKDETIHAKDAQIEELKLDKTKLTKQLEWERLPWYKKLFTPPPD